MDSHDPSTTRPRGLERLRRSVSSRVARFRIASAVSIVLGAAYFLASRGMRNLFPFTVLDMYSTQTSPGASRIVAIDASGSERYVTDYVSWSCPGPLDTSRYACPELTDYATIPYAERDDAAYIDAHGGSSPAGRPVDIVRRAWSFDDAPGPLPHRDCLLQRCRAVAR